MTVKEPDGDQYTPAPAMVKRATIAGAIGTAVEWYDYQIYGAASAVILTTLFYPDVDPTVGLLATFATFAVGFVSRPFGAMAFGHLGDRHGRKRMLVASILLMGIATVGIGLLPTYAMVGIWAPILLLVLRLVQGFAVGGEWGGATVLATEYSPPRQRGFIGSIVQMGSPAGLLLATGAFALVTLMPRGHFESWGWRLPFLASIVLVGIGLYIRLHIFESPEFRRAQNATQAATQAQKLPVVTLFREHRRSLLVTIGARFAPDIGFYVTAIFVASYASSRFGYGAGTILFAVMVGAFLEMVTVPLWGALSDRVGRRRVYLSGAAFWFVFAFPYFWMINSGNVALLWLGIIVAMVFGHGPMWSVAAALYTELYPTHVRLTGVSMGYHIANALGGGLAPLIATALVAAASGASTLVSVYLMIAAVVTFLTIVTIKETAARSLHAKAADAAADSPTSEGQEVWTGQK